jgi:hypothetical protein
MSSVVSPSSFNVSKITFSPVKMLESGGKQAYLNYEGRPLVMQVGPLETPFGLSVYDKTSPPKYSVDLKLRGYDDATAYPKVAVIYNALHSLDDFMLEQGVKNSKQWFKGDKSRDVLSELYTTIIRFSKDADGNVKPYPPTLKLQLRKRDDKFETQVYDDKKRLITDIPMEDVLVKGSVLTALIQCTGVWFAGGKYGLSWKAIQIRADTIPERIRGFAFLDDGESGSSAERQPPQKQAAAAASASTNRFDALHDDEDEIDDEEALAPASAPAVAPSVAPSLQQPQQPQQQAVEMEDDDEEAPIPVPAKKTTITKKKVVVAAKK